MSRLQRILCLGAALPLLAAFAWTRLASWFPEPWSDRQMLGELVVRWDLPAWATVGQEHAHVLGRLIPLVLLNLPGMQISKLALMNAVLAIALGLLLAAPLAAAYRRARLPAAYAMAFSALLCATPALGSTWLYGERAALFVSPILFLVVLRCLQSEQPFGRSAAIAVVAAGIAPFFHGNGACLALALLPAFRQAARRHQSPHASAWQLLFLLVGVVAAASSIAPAGGIALGSQGVLGRLWEAPFEAALQLVNGLGQCLLDPLANTDVDATALGALALLMPCSILLRRPASADSQRLDAVSLSCLCYGLLVVLWQMEHLGLGADAATARALSIGSCLVFVGSLGLLTLRLPRTQFAVLVGAFGILLALDWQNGLEALRIARTTCEQAESRLLLPEDCVGERDETMLTVRSQSEFDQLMARHAVPRASPFQRESLQTAATSPADRMRGAIAECTPTLIHGSVRSSLFGDTPSAVVALSATGDGPFAPVGHAWPGFQEAGRNAAFTMQLQRPLTEGSRIRVVCISPRSGACRPIGPMLRMREGKVIKESGQ